MVYSKSRPAKRKRATLESDPPRDIRMGCDGCPSGRGVNNSPADHSGGQLELPQCLVNSRGSPGGMPLAKDLFPEQLAVVIAEQQRSWSAGPDHPASWEELALPPWMRGSGRVHRSHRGRLRDSLMRFGHLGHLVSRDLPIPQRLSCVDQL